MPPPPALRRYLGFARLSARSLDAVARVVERDDEFRSRVAAAVDEGLVGRAGWLWLARPEGWLDELAGLEAAAEARTADATEQRAERAATKRLAAAEEAARRVDAQVAAQLVELDELRAQLTHEQSARAAAEARAAELDERVAELTTGRAEVVRNLKEVEARLVDRNMELKAVKARVRALEAEARLRREPAGGEAAALPTARPPGGASPAPAATPALGPTGAPAAAPSAAGARAASATGSAVGDANASGAVPAGGAVPGATAGEAPVLPGTAGSAPRLHASPGAGVDPEAIGAEVARAAAGAAELAAALRDVARLLSVRPATTPPTTSGTGPGGVGPAAFDGDAPDGEAALPTGSPDVVDLATPRARRVPVTLPGGIFDDTVEAAEHLLRTPAAVLVVDGYNITMAAWPELRAADQRRRLLVALSDLAARTATRVELVFDGADVAPLTVPSPTRQLVRVRFSDPGVEADDVVIDLVGRIPAATPVIVASSDNRVRDGARWRGANLLHARQLVAVLRR